MERRDPPDDTRRAIEGLLGTTRRSADPEIIEVEPDDAYAPTGIGTTASDPEPARKRSGSGGRTVIITISLVLVFIAFVVVGLLFARDWLGGLLPESSSELASLREEIVHLKATIAAEDDTRIVSLTSANENLERALAEEKQRVLALQSEIESLRNATSGDSTAAAEGAARLQTAEAEVKRLQDAYEAARGEIATLTREREQSGERIASFSRENSRIYREIETLRAENSALVPLRAENEKLTGEIATLRRDLSTARSELQVLQASAQRGSDTSAQLEKVNDEYRRVLSLLKDSRDAVQQKQERIDTLTGENSSLRQQVNNLETRVRQLTAENLSAGGRQTASAATSVVKDSAPRPVSVVKPEYPESARRRQVSGTVQVRVLVGEDGSVLDAQISSSPDPQKALDRAALTAVRKWRFEPARKDGKIVRAWHTVPLEFTLKRQD
jgi:TonB family protein